MKGVPHSFHRISALMLAVIMLLQLLPARIFAASSPENSTGQSGLETTAGDETAKANLSGTPAGIPAGAGVAVTLSYQFSTEGNVNAAPSNTYYGTKGNAISIDLPKADAVPEIKGLTPAILPAVNRTITQEAKDAAAELDKMLLPDRTAFSIQAGDASWDTFIHNCEAAGFLNRDAGGHYETNEAGDVIIHVPVTYQLGGQITYFLSYRLQDLDAVTQVPLETYHTEYKTDSFTIQDTNIVSFELPEIPGYTPTIDAEQKAWRSVVSADPNTPTTILLTYNRKLHPLSFDTQGGSRINPMDIPHGADIIKYLAGRKTAQGGETRFSDPVKPGYTLTGWAAAPDGNTETTITMDGPGTIYAKWRPSDTLPVKIVYWLENPNDSGYTFSNKIEIFVPNNKDLSFDGANGTTSLAEYTTSAALAANTPLGHPGSDGKPDPNLDESSFFSWNTGKTPAVIPLDRQGGQTVNLYFTRNEYTLIFHISRYGRELGVGFKKEIVARDGISKSKNTADWDKGFSWYGAPSPAKMPNPSGGKEINMDQPYTITAKYGANISALWPDPIEAPPIFNKIVRRILTSWCTQQGSYYFSNHTSKNIAGIHPVMDRDLLMADGRKEHHLVGYWNVEQISSMTHYYYLGESMPDAEGRFPDGSGDVQTEMQAKTFDQLNTALQFTPASTPEVQGRYFVTELHEAMSSGYGDEAYGAPKIPGMNSAGTYTAQNGSIYFFYTCIPYSVTFHYNLPGGQESVIGDIRHTPSKGRPADDFSLKNRLNKGYDASTDPLRLFLPLPPDDPIRDAAVLYENNGNRFCGWYYDSAFTSPVDWETDLMPRQDLQMYAKWEDAPVTVSFRVPDGSITALDSNPDWVRSADKEFTVYTNENTPKGRLDDTLRKILSEGPDVSTNHKKFTSWNYNDGNAYVYTTSNEITGPMTLTARWAPDMSGRYTAYYLAEEDPGTNLGAMVHDFGNGSKTYYIMGEPQTVTGLEVGSRVTVKAPRFPGHEDFIPKEGSADIRSLVPAADGEGNPVWPSVYFLYTPHAGRLEYTVHYVEVQLDPATGKFADYGNRPPVEGKIVRRAPDQKGSLTISKTDVPKVVTIAKGIPGFTVIGQHTKETYLSMDPDANHIYHYYVPNSTKGKYILHIYFQDASGQYPPAPDLSDLNGEAPVGQIITAANVAGSPQGYFKGDALTDFREKAYGHAYDAQRYGGADAPAELIRIQGEPVVSELNVYLKRIPFRVSYDAAGRVEFPDKLKWDAPGSHLQQDSQVPGLWTESVLWADAAGVPASSPVHPAHEFLGWEYGGKVYETGQLHTLPLFQTGQDKGVRQDTVFTGQWRPFPRVYFNTRGGTWDPRNDSSADRIYIEVPEMEQTTVVTYVKSGATIPKPDFDPSYQTKDGIPLAFIGWTTTRPEPKPNSTFYDANGRVDRAKFDAEYNFFKKPQSDSIPNELQLYAVWDPPAFSFHVKKTDLSGNPLAGATFELKRLQSRKADVCDFDLKLDSSGNPIVDSGFAPRRFTTDAGGLITYEYLPAGFYSVTEVSFPPGYPGELQDPEPAIIYYRPGTSEGCSPTPMLDGRTQNKRVSVSASENGYWTLKFQNRAQYKWKIQAPSQLNFTYDGGLVWDPRTLTYVPDPSKPGTWTQDSGSSSDIWVQNLSELQGSIAVAAEFRTASGYEALAPKAEFSGTLTKFGGAQQPGPVSSVPIQTGGRIIGHRLDAGLAQNDKLSVFLTLHDPMPVVTAAPVQAGTITIRIKPPYQPGDPTDSP